jgi:hypothetical protein
MLASASAERCDANRLAARTLVVRASCCTFCGACVMVHSACWQRRAALLCACCAVRVVRHQPRAAPRGMPRAAWRALHVLRGVQHCVCVCVRACARACGCAHARARMAACLRACVRTCVRACVYMWSSVYGCTYICVYVYCSTARAARACGACREAGRSERERVWREWADLLAADAQRPRTMYAHAARCKQRGTRCVMLQVAVMRRRSHVARRMLHVACCSRYAARRTATSFM